MSHRYPESHVFYRNLRREFPLIASARGCWLTADDGTQYLDACGGAMVVNVGHGVAEIADAMAEQARSLAYVSGAAFTHAPVEELAQMLCERSPAFAYAYFLSSGSDAVEAALKLARQHWVDRGMDSKHRVIALSPGYHGNTLLALSASARQHYRRVYNPWLVETIQIPAPYAYRCQCQGSASCPVCTGDMLEEVIRREGAETIAAFIAEPVGGSSTGASVPRPEYFGRVREICNQYNVLFVADEVLCGAGRTGHWLALDAWGVNADIVTLGKGISGGYAPLSAVLATERVVAPIAAGSGSFIHAQTFSHHPVLCAAGVAALRYMDDNRLVQRADEMGRVLHAHLDALRRLPHVGDVRGRGMLAGVEFVRDAATREPFPRSARFVEQFVEAAQRAGLVVWPNIGHADGVNGDLVLIAPPFVITEDEMGELVRRFEQALLATLGSQGEPAADMRLAAAAPSRTL